MKLASKFALALTAGLLATTCLAQARLSGVHYLASSEIRPGVKVQLNGAGIRYRGPFKVYTAGLYLSRAASTAEEVLAAAGAKRLAVTMLREIDASELGKLFIRSVEDNLDRSTFSRVVPGLMRMSQIFSDQRKLSAGDSFTIDWVPGVGTVISVRGVPQGEPFKEAEFYQALMRIWLGPAPADWQLKEQLLGRDPRA
ncbi:MAG: chalcone isomerase family protein [Burkholderiales bacterium]|nr:chalcone isomerase family protein [Burkholderiales bacterium]